MTSTASTPCELGDGGRRGARQMLVDHQRVLVDAAHQAPQRRRCRAIPGTRGGDQLDAVRHLRRGRRVADRHRGTGVGRDPVLRLVDAVAAESVPVGEEGLRRRTTRCVVRLPVRTWTSSSRSASVPTLPRRSMPAGRPRRRRRRVRRAGHRVRTGWSCARAPLPRRVVAAGRGDRRAPSPSTTW